MVARVDVLRYGFVVDDDGEDYSAAAAWEGELGGFRCRLADGVLTARPAARRAGLEVVEKLLTSKPSPSLLLP